jgi:hypothetical protein
MILGMSLATFTLLHVVLSLVGMLASVVALAGMIAGRPLGGWNGIFLAATAATSVTGFFFPFTRFLPSHALGVISLVVLAVALAAFHGGAFGVRARAVYAATATLALYLNVFVGVVQAFQKFPRLAVLAPTQSEPPFAVAQAVVLVVFVVLGVLAVRRFRLP